MINMGTYIELDEDSSALLEKYCNEAIRPAKPGPVLSRIIRPWYARAAKEWVKNKGLIPDLEPIGEKRTHAVSINSDHANMFRGVLNTVNERTGSNIGEVELVSWLTRMFIKMHRIRERAEGYKLRMGNIKKV